MGRFTRRSPLTRPASLNLRFAKGVAWGDHRRTTAIPDLYVSNIGPNRLYRNRGDGTFEDVAEELGVDEPRGRSFTTWFFDHDNDGDLDLFVADYGATLDEVAGHYLGLLTAGGHPRLYRNEGGEGFEDVSREVGLTTPCLPMGANYGDLDNDGYIDFFLGTGTPSFESIAPNLMYRNDGGRRFVDVTYSGGFGHLQKGHGVAFADVDHDGDQDVFEQMGGAYPGDAYPSVLYENPGHGNSWIVLELVGVSSNRSAIGARIAITVEGSAEGRRTIRANVGSGGSFGGSPFRQEIGLGQAERIEEIRVTWPRTGREQRLAGVAMRRHYELREDTDVLRPLERPAMTLGGGAR